MPAFDGKASCVEIGGDTWYPESGGEGLIMAREARKVCRGCEIRFPCLQWALDNAEPWGIWGGLTEVERRRITGRRRVA
jgi:WhiB family redox-sensing transcriptional regulator